MTKYGYFLASEEHEPQELARQARLAEEAGFDALWISDRDGQQAHGAHERNGGRS